MNESVFKAMSDGTRRKVLELLKNGPMTAGDIASRFPHAQPTISRHLSVLKNANLVVDERDGTFIMYRLNTTVLQEWLAWVMEHFGGGDGHEDEDEDENELESDREDG
ncbi:autorepressor SdpR family transcription factor [Alicyclobacillus sp. ALC3]|uniref:autorepressor SdpR family transcription factor n=1 Tax=Alicyclobacillus sp. ALC3 TaxID=2796143 RepID=UPI002379EF74|nr:autorepressor SdpR family transcription factor [Alicyclobacillus sp. ALC3]WDL95975.1 winged helix-turn-helix transcriptional regulator [Alicyclobacillus sp. ALC3]